MSIRDHRSRGKDDLAILFLLTLLVVSAYANSFTNDFASDDYFIIVKNRLITDLNGIPALYTKDYWASMRDPNEAIPPPTTGLYRPLAITTYALNFAVGALDPFGYHLVNLLLHLLVTWLVYFLAVHLSYSPSAALATAAVFAVHPLHTEAVTGIVGRAELLMAAAVLGGFLLDLRGYRWGALGVFALGLLSKEQAAVLPVLMLLSDLCLNRLTAVSPSNVEPRTLIRVSGMMRYAGYAAVLAVYLALRAYVLGGLRPPPIDALENPVIFAEWLPRLLTLLKIAGYYLWLFVWPVGLSADYSYNAVPLARSLADPWVLWGLASWGSLMGTALWAYRRDARLTFCVGLLFVTFLPVSNLIVPIGTMMAERFFYLPSVGLCLLVGWGWDRVLLRFRPRPDLLRGAVALLVFVCLVLTLRTGLRNRDWADTETLFRHAVQVMPTNAKVYVYLGKAFKDGGKLDQALEAYQTALRLYPEFRTRGDFNAGYGDLLLQIGRVDEGTQALQEAVRLDPGWSVTRYNLGLAYARQRRYVEAENQWRQALTLNPRAPHIHNSLSRLFIERGQFAEALLEADAALQQNADYVLALGNRAWTLEGLGRLDEAAVGYERVLEKNPGFNDLRLRLEALRARLALSRDR